MERLTWIDQIQDKEYIGMKKGVVVGDVVAKLADYENTDLTPAEIEQLKANNEEKTGDDKKIITNFERIKNMTVEDMAEWMNSPIPDDLISATADKEDDEITSALIDWLNQTVTNENATIDEQ